MLLRSYKVRVCERERDEHDAAENSAKFFAMHHISLPVIAVRNGKSPK